MKQIERERRMKSYKERQPERWTRDRCARNCGNSGGAAFSPGSAATPFSTCLLNAPKIKTLTTTKLDHDYLTNATLASLYLYALNKRNDQWE